MSGPVSLASVTAWLILGFFGAFFLPGGSFSGLAFFQAANSLAAFFAAAFSAATEAAISSRERCLPKYVLSYLPATTLSVVSNRFRTSVSSARIISIKRSVLAVASNMAL